MHISIAARLRPFSHRPGIMFILPGSTLRFEIFPAFLRVCDLSHSKPRLLSEITLNVEGPVKDFTVTQDLERGQIKVWGHSQKGYFRYRISPIQNAPKKASLTLEKTFPGFAFSHEPFETENAVQIPHIENLSLGNHKAPDWDFISRRLDLAEILPLWFRLGQLIPKAPSKGMEGTLSLIEKCQHTIQNKDILHIIENLGVLYLAGFDVGLSPRLEDTSYHGIKLPKLNSNSDASPLTLLTEGYAIIRSLFFRSDQNQLRLLPALPPQFHCGRILGIKYEGGSIDFEWTKKSLRRLVLKTSQADELRFELPHVVKRFRMRTSMQDKGRVFARDDVFKVEANQTYYFDHFES